MDVSVSGVAKDIIEGGAIVLIAGAAVVVVSYGLNYLVGLL